MTRRGDTFKHCISLSRDGVDMATCYADGFASRLALLVSANMMLQPLDKARKCLW